MLGERGRDIRHCLPALSGVRNAAGRELDDVVLLSLSRLQSGAGGEGGESGDEGELHYSGLLRCIIRRDGSRCIRFTRVIVDEAKEVVMSKRTTIEVGPDGRFFL